MKMRLLAAFLFLFWANAILAQDKLFTILKSEINREYDQLKKNDDKLYYMSYRVEDILTYRITSSFGVINNIDSGRRRIFTPDVRYGSYKLDNMHGAEYGNASTDLPLHNNEDAIRLVLWSRTDGAFKNALSRYENIATGKKVRAAEEDTASDFSASTPSTFFDPPFKSSDVKCDINNMAAWQKQFTAALKKNPSLLTGQSMFEFRIIRKYFVDTDGTNIIENSTGTWQLITGNTKADDGMDLPLTLLYFAYTPSQLPGRDSILKDVASMSAKLTKLQTAPIADPYAGPAILSGRASGVFFHEIFGHRLEGKRMKSDNDGQTFKKRIGSAVLPSFLSITMDPTSKNVGKNAINGFYQYDDEGVKSQKVNLVQNGILKNFLMTRTPINGVTGSNGHARTATGGVPESRQSNLIVTSSFKKSDAELRAILIGACKKQGKPYGYWFEDVEGGFTFIGRTVPNAFNVLPTEVYKVYVDGRPDELVRGIDLIGTPLSMFMRIQATGLDTKTFNGTCGAGSGWVPVSASSPAIFVDLIETQKKTKSTERAPVLKRPDLEQPAGF